MYEVSNQVYRLQMIKANVHLLSTQRPNGFLKSILEPTICCCGIVGITLTMIVLSRKTMCTSTNCYLTALAVADLLFLLILSARILVEMLADCRFYQESENAIFIEYSSKGRLEP